VVEVSFPFLGLRNELEQLEDDGKLTAATSLQKMGRFVKENKR
jgi:hypothetical protein